MGLFNIGNWNFWLVMAYFPNNIKSVIDILYNILYSRDITLGKSVKFNQEPKNGGGGGRVFESQDY